MNGTGQFDLKKGHCCSFAYGYDAPSLLLMIVDWQFAKHLEQDCGSLFQMSQIWWEEIVVLEPYNELKLYRRREIDVRIAFGN